MAVDVKPTVAASHAAISKQLPNFPISSSFSLLQFSIHVLSPLLAPPLRSPRRLPLSPASTPSSPGVHQRHLSAIVLAPDCEPRSAHSSASLSPRRELLCNPTRVRSPAPPASAAKPSPLASAAAYLSSSPSTSLLLLPIEKDQLRFTIQSNPTRIQKGRTKWI